MIEIRKSLITDYEEIAKMEYDEYIFHSKIRPEIFDEKNYKKLERADFEQKIENVDKILFTALCDNEIAGFLEADFCVRQLEYIWIAKIYIKENFRGKSIGRLLIQKIEEIAKERQIHIELNCWEGNTAIDFYNKLGFKIQRYIMEKK